MFASKSLFQKLPVALGALLMSLAVVGCGPAYPRDVEIEYRVTSETLTEAGVTYTNATDGLSSLDAVELPFTITVQRTVEQYDNLGLSAQTSGNGNLTLEILVDGESVKLESFSGESFVSGTSVYIFE